MSNALKFLLELDASQAKAALASFQSSLSGALRGATNAVGGNPLASISAGAAKATSSIGGLASSFINLKSVSVAAAGAFAKATIDASENAENAFRGLESVANRSGVGIVKAWGAVQQLTADGLMSQTEAATALKNLFSRGFGLDEAVVLINRFKDAAAYGRQQALAFGEAVVGATEGVKNENSALVDNSGVTRNVFQMWEEYAKKIKKTTNDLTLAEKRQAEYNGILEETAGKVGDAKKLQEGLSGANAKLSKSWTELQATIGDGLKPAYTDLLEVLTKVADKTKQIIEDTRKVDYKQTGFLDRMAAMTTGGAALVGRNQEAQRKVGALPPMPLPSGAIPPLSTNTTGIKVVAPLGPGGRPIVDNIDKEAVARKAQKEADEKTKADAKAELGRSEKRLKREASDSKNSLDIYRSGLEAQKAVLDKKLAEESISKTEYARQAAALEVQEVVKAEDLRAKRILELRKAVEVAKKTGDAEMLAEAEQNLRDEEAATEASANKLKAIRTKGSTESIAASRQEAEERRRIEEQLLSARIDAERTTGEAIRDREIAAVESKVAQRVMTEEEGIKKIAALKDAELEAELERIKTLQAFYASQSGLTPAQAAAVAVQQEKLKAQVVATEAKREEVAAEANAKIAEGARELARIRVELEQELLEVQGRTFDAQSAQIDAWLEEKKKQLAQFPELLAKAEAVASGRKKNLAFEQAQETIGKDNSQFERDQAALTRRSQAGLIADIDYDRESLALKKKQAEVLRERLELLRQNSNGSTSAVAAIQELEDKIMDLDSAMSEVAKSIDDNFFSAVEKGFQDLFSGAKKPLEALRDVAVSVLKQIADMALRYSLQKLFMGMGFGGGGGLGGAVMSLFGGFRASGGAVSGDQAYITGERGAEMFFPGQPGNVVPTARIMQVLSGMMSSQTRNPAAAFSASREAVQPGNTSVSVAPKVVIGAGDVLSAILGLPEFEKHIVQVVAANGKRIQSTWS